MTVTRLTLSNFRSYDDAVITPGAGFVVLTGENGAGKTNVLEAVSLLVPGRGLRGAALSEMARSGGDGSFAVAVDTADSVIGTGTAANAPERRIVRINGAAAPLSALSEWLSIIWLTPAMDRLFSDTAGERRRFLDRLVLALDPGHGRTATRYEAAMRQRNRLLGGDTPPDAAWLTALEAQMAEYGAALGAARLALVDALNAELAQQIESPFARAALSLDGWLWSSDFARTLAQNRARDAAAGRALIGPHRADLIVTHVAKAQPAGRCSTGEQKALLLGIVLGHADLVARRVGRRPLLLLDEIAAHLDPRRRAALFGRLADGGGQVWMTGTEASLFNGLGTSASWWHVAGGVIHG
jgi:DNA replication and repair protein RecF